MERRERGRRWGGCASIVVLALSPAVARAGGDGSNVRLVHVVEKATVARALDGATRRLAHPECQALLDEFKGVSGRPLRVALEEFGVSAPEYLGRVYFYDAPPRLCGISNLAVTTPGSRAVLVCGSRFALQAGRSARHAEAVLIHEALHSLGLGENPPSSDAITERVLARCGQR
jgi:hypothetical protein